MPHPAIPKIISFLAGAALGSLPPKPPPRPTKYKEPKPTPEFIDQQKEMSKLTNAMYLKAFMAHLNRHGLLKKDGWFMEQVKKGGTTEQDLFTSDLALFAEFAKSNAGKVAVALGLSATSTVTAGIAVVASVPFILFRNVFRGAQWEQWHIDFEIPMRKALDTFVDQYGAPPASLFHGASLVPVSIGSPNKNFSATATAIQYATLAFKNAKYVKNVPIAPPAKLQKLQQKLNVRYILNGAAPVKSRAGRVRWYCLSPSMLFAENSTLLGAYTDIAKRWPQQVLGSVDFNDTTELTYLRNQTGEKISVIIKLVGIEYYELKHNGPFTRPVAAFQSTVVVDLTSNSWLVTKGSRF